MPATLYDLWKCSSHSDPNLVDTDGDGVPDGTEVMAGSDPRSATNYPSILLGFWHFDDTNYLGESGQMPLIATNLQIAAAWISNGVAINSTNAARLVYRDAESNGMANITCPAGSIRFWFRPTWFTTNGAPSNGRFVELGSLGTTNDWWTLMIHSNGTKVSFCTETNGTATTNLSATVNWASNTFYQLVLTYTATNSSLYINGTIVTNGSGVSYWPRKSVRAQGLSIGSDSTGTQQVKGTIDELQTYNYPLDANDILVSYQSFSTDTDQNGLSDSWEMTYFGHLGVDPYADPDGDGWSNLEEFQLGTNPTVFNSPPPPSDFISVRAGSHNNLSWSPSPGSVTNYTIEYSTGGSFFSATNVSSATTSVSVANLSANTITYRIRANYSNGTSFYATSAVSVFDPTMDSPAAVVRGPNGSLYFAVMSMPTNTDYYLLERTEVDPVNYPLTMWPYDTDFIGVPQTLFTPSLATGEFTLAASAFTNRICQIPTNQMAPFAQTQITSSYAHRTDGRYSDATSIEGGSWPLIAPITAIPFINGTEHINQNTAFLLRAADDSYPFHFNTTTYLDSGYTMDPSYATAGFHEYQGAGSSGSTHIRRNEFTPFENQFLFNNFIYNTTNLHATGNLTTGVGIDYAGNFTFTNLPHILFPTYKYVTNSTHGTIATCLSSNDSRWIYGGYHDDFDISPNALGLYTDDDYENIYLDSDARNLYGLKILSVKCPTTNNPVQFVTLTPGSSAQAVAGYYYFETEQPVLATVDYYFCQPDYFGLRSLYGLSHGDTLMPGASDFTGTNSVPLIGFLRTSTVVAAWARQQIVNGYTNKFAYVEQYFDKAYLADSGGNMSTNETGILSEYGDFFPTEAGKIFLTTKADANGLRGTNVIYIVGLQLDANQDGQINGQDGTTPGHPLVFWANNDVDRGHNVDCDFLTGHNCDFEQDDLLINDASLAGFERVPDCQATNTAGLRIIPSTRDLEDYTRLWLPGIFFLATNLATGYTLELGWGSSSTNNPTLDLFPAYETNGGNLYLTNETEADFQINGFFAPYSGRVKPGSNIVLYAGGDIPKEHFIFCGVSNGVGVLTLMIRPPTGGSPTPVGYAYVQIKDIKDMYERWTIGDVSYALSSNYAALAQNNLPAGSPAFHYSYDSQIDTNKPYILYVHGWNMEPWEKDRFAETAFKRLYWQGYKGRFGAFRWPTGNGFEPPISVVADANNYDKSEYTAWQSGYWLKSKLAALNALYPGNVYVMAHSMGNVVTGEALRLATNQLVNTYIAMEAAVPAHCYDPVATYRVIPPYTQDNGTPNRYAEYWTNGAPCYFNGTVGAGSYVNFFNANDYALKNWQLDQNLKPAETFGYAYKNGQFILYDYTNVLGFPTNTYEIFAFCDEARCYALGAQPNMGGCFKVGATYDQIDLGGTPYNFGKEHKYHSGQFRSTNMERWNFWEQLLIQMNLKE